MKCCECKQENLPNSKFCSRCGAKIAFVCPKCNQLIGADSLFCNWCGQKLQSSGSVGLQYSENIDGTYSLAGIGVCKDSDIIVPHKYYGKLVTGISENAFSYCKSIVSITIPENIIIIGKNAFLGCENLLEVSVSEDEDSPVAYWLASSKVTTICEAAFAYCTSLKSTPIFHEAIRIERRAFEGCRALYSAYIPSGITKISEYAFYGCTSLNHISINMSVKEFGHGVLYNCESLEYIEYTGKSEHWELFEKGDKWDYNTPRYMIRCRNKRMKKKININE